MIKRTFWRLLMILTHQVIQRVWWSNASGMPNCLAGVWNIGGRRIKLRLGELKCFFTFRVHYSPNSWVFGELYSFLRFRAFVSVYLSPEIMTMVEVETFRISELVKLLEYSCARKRRKKNISHNTECSWSRHRRCDYDQVLVLCHRTVSAVSILNLSNILQYSI